LVTLISSLISLISLISLTISNHYEENAYSHTNTKEISFITAHLSFLNKQTLTFGQIEVADKIYDSMNTPIPPPPFSGLG